MQKLQVPASLEKKNKSKMYLSVVRMAKKLTDKPSVVNVVSVTYLEIIKVRVLVYSLSAYIKYTNV